MDRIFIKRGLDARFGTDSPVTSCIIVNEELPRKYKSIAKLYSSSLHVYCLRLCLDHIMFGYKVPNTLRFANTLLISIPRQARAPQGLMIQVRINRKQIDASLFHKMSYIL